MLEINDTHFSGHIGYNPDDLKDLNEALKARVITGRPIILDGTESVQWTDLTPVDLPPFYYKWTKQYHRDFYKTWIDPLGMDYKKQIATVKKLRKVARRRNPFWDVDFNSAFFKGE